MTAKRIPLSRGHFALVSERDYEHVSKHKWSLDSSNGYACRTESYYVGGVRKRRKILLHRYVMSAPAGLAVDHINRDPLDNRRENLRFATYSQNRANSAYVRGASPFRGVTRYHRDNKWRAEITVNGIHKSIGIFDRQEDAARAYDYEALLAWGDFAYLNHEHLRPLYLQAIVTTRLHRSMLTIARG